MRSGTVEKYFSVSVFEFSFERCGKWTVHWITNKNILKLTELAEKYRSV